MRWFLIPKEKNIVIFSNVWGFDNSSIIMRDDREWIMYLEMAKYTYICPNEIIVYCIPKYIWLRAQMQYFNCIDKYYYQCESPRKTQILQ